MKNSESSEKTSIENDVSNPFPRGQREHFARILFVGPKSCFQLIIKTGNGFETRYWGNASPGVPPRTAPQAWVQENRSAGKPAGYCPEYGFVRCDAIPHHPGQEGLTGEIPFGKNRGRNGIMLPMAGTKPDLPWFMESKNSMKNERWSENCLVSFNV